MVKDLVSILVPTRGRARELKKNLKLIDKNTHYQRYELILMIDDDDEPAEKICKDFRLKYLVHHVTEETRDFYVAKINNGFKHSKGQYLVYLSNDVEVGSRWLMHAIKCFNANFPDDIGIVAFDDGFWQDKLAPHGLVSRKWIDTYQFGEWLLWPEYIHWHADNELTRVAKSLGRFAYCPESKAIHTRPKDPEKRDFLYREAVGYCGPIDDELFRQRLSEGFPGYGSNQT